MPPHVVLTCMSRRFTAASLRYWLTHHQRAGVSRVLLRWEHAHADDACAAVLADFAAFATVLETAPPPAIDSPEATIARQVAFVTAALAHVRGEGPEGPDATWLVHIDDDELLFSARGLTLGDAFALVPAAADNAILSNLEAVREDSASGCRAQAPTAPFYSSDELLFRRGVAGYANGKAAARCGAPHVRPLGVHRFAGTTPFTMPGDALVVLHFDVLDIPSWQQKFRQRGRKLEAPALATLAATPMVRDLPYYWQSLHASDLDVEAVFRRYRTVDGHVMDLGLDTQLLERVHFDRRPMSPLTLPPPALPLGAAQRPPPLTLPLTPYSPTVTLTEPLSGYVLSEFGDTPCE
jgi:hypothetical protein